LIPLPLEALGRALTPFCSVCRQFFGFIPSSVHVLQISSDDVHPVVPWSSRLSLVAAQFPLYRLKGILDSAILNSGVAGPLAAQGGGQICRPFVLGV